MIILALALLLVAGMAGAGTFAYFSDTETSTGNTFTAGTMDLKVVDWNELTWKDGVTATWTATNMKPGDELPFLAEFVGLGRVGTITPNHLEITCDYSVIEEDPQTEADTDPNTNLNPDKMAKQLVITRFLYNGVDYLSSIQDKDGDLKKTFYDLKQAPVDNLPIPPIADGQQNFRLSVKFDENAGNDFQGDTLNLTMIFTLNQDASQ
ncbi:MAG: TasA family protein [Thermoanaerobacteraceae bacterium]|jgi:predicted ribosomally synthesized peptide with SipW-like signal peptide|nr:TasA family protein [Thermoanaerobacteraceae bacterium]